VVWCGPARDAAEGWRCGGGQQIGTNDEARGRLCRCSARQQASRTALRYELFSTPMGEAGCQAGGIRRQK